MSRVLAFALVLAALVGLFFLPQARPTALAALHGQTLLDEEVPDPAPDAAEGATVPLWELVLRSPNYSEPADGEARLVLGYARLFIDDTLIRRTGSTGNVLIGNYESDANLFSVQVNYVFD